jgi:hypothetical protein
MKDKNFVNHLYLKIEPKKSSSVQLYLVSRSADLQDAIRQIFIDELGFGQVPNYFDIDTTKEVRFCGANLKNSGAVQTLENDSYHIKTTEKGGLYVKYNSYYGDQRSGCFIVDVNNTTGNDYLKRKQCSFFPLGLRYKKRYAEGNWNTENLVVPAYDLDGNEQSYQTIQPNGRKMNAKGKALKGNFFPVYHGDWRTGQIIYLAEGLATAISIYEATNQPCLVVFGTGGFLAVIRAIKTRYPELEERLVWAGDNDALAVRIPQYIAGSKLRYVLPYLPAFNKSIPTENKGNDFNDLFVCCGAEETKRQLENLIQAESIAPNNKLARFIQRAPSQPPSQPRKSQKQVEADEAGELVVTGEIKIKDCYLMVNQNALYYKEQRDIVVYDNMAATKPYFAYYHENRIQSVVFKKTRPAHETFVEKGARFYNAYASSEKGPGCPEKGKIIHAFVVSTFPHSYEYLEQFSACLLQDPEVLLNRYPVLVGPQGTGKSSYATLLSKLLGIEYCHDTMASTIAGRFGGPELSNKMLVVGNELNIDLLKKEGTYDNFNHRVGDKRISAEKKGRDEVQETRTANYIFTSNHTTQVAKYINERRLRWVASRSTPPKNQSIFDKIYHLFEDQEAIDGYRNNYIKKVDFSISDLRNPHNGLEDALRLAEHGSDNYLNFINSININDFGSIALDDLAAFANANDSNFKNLLSSDDSRQRNALNTFKNRIKNIMISRGWDVMQVRHNGRRRSLINPKVARYTHMANNPTIPCNALQLKFIYNMHEKIADTEDDFELEYLKRLTIMDRELYVERVIKEYEDNFGPLKT